MSDRKADTRVLWKDTMTNQWSHFYNAKGRFAFRKMFYEMHPTEESREAMPPLFTLKPHEHNGLPSAYEVYMSAVDEYDAATKLVPNMKMWDMLASTGWFLNGQRVFEGLAVWRKHMMQRDASLARATLLEKTRNGDTTAAKAVLAETKVKAPVGRKPKKTAQEEASDNRIKNFKLKAVGSK